MPANVNAIKVEAAALSLLQRYGITKPAFSVEDVAYAEGIVIERSPLRNLDAWLVRQGDRAGIIRVRDDMNEVGRFRFSIGHELGHWTMHPTLSQRFLCTASDFTDYARSPQEIEANLFAANFLMPRIWMKPKTWQKDPSFELVNEIALNFQTTLTASARRYTELCNRGVVLVFSTDGKIQWTVTNNRSKAAFIQYGSSVPEHSLTRECLNSGISSTGPEEVGLETWLPTWRCDDDSELFEDVKVATRYGWALTLLWIPSLG